MKQQNEMKHKPLEIPQNRDALLRRAFAEPDGCLSVGGLACGLETAKATGEATRLSLARLIELTRRHRQLTVEQLAKEADVDLVELLAIENAEDVKPEPRTLHRLAGFLKVKVEGLLELAGAVTNRQSRIGEAALRFAARSEPMAKLTPEEEKALNEFVRELSKS